MLNYRTINHLIGLLAGEIATVSELRNRAHMQRLILQRLIFAIDAELAAQNFASTDAGRQVVRDALFVKTEALDILDKNQ